jgi:hypothetical protein
MHEPMAHEIAFIKRKPTKTIENVTNKNLKISLKHIKTNEKNKIALKTERDITNEPKKKPKQTQTIVHSAHQKSFCPSIFF